MIHFVTPLLVALVAVVVSSGCAAPRDPDDPAYGSESQTPDNMEREEADWEERDADL